MIEVSPFEPNSARPRQATARLTRDNPNSRRRARWYERLREHPLSDVSQDEVDSHFATMPGRYWERVTKAELMWGLEMVHAHRERMEAVAPGVPVVVADSRHYPERGFTKVMICSADRTGLLAKIAAAFGALRINILRADVYTRSDGLALDLFEVSDPNHGHVDSTERVRHLVFLLEGALSEPQRFVSVWAGQFHKTVPFSADSAAEVEFDNESSLEHTVVRVRAKDRMGLLFDLLESLGANGLNIDQALVETEDSLAADAFYVTDLRGAKVTRTEHRTKLRSALLEAIRGPS